MTRLPLLSTGGLLAAADQQLLGAWPPPAPGAGGKREILQINLAKTTTAYANASR